MQAGDEVDLGLEGIVEDLRVEQDLVGLAEAKVELVLVEQLLVRLERSAPRRTGALGSSRTRGQYLCSPQLHYGGAEAAKSRTRRSAAGNKKSDAAQWLAAGAAWGIGRRRRTERARNALCAPCHC